MAIYRVPIELNWAGPGSPGVNVWHLRTADETPTDTVRELGEGVDAIHAFYDSLKNLYPSSWNANLGEVTNIQTQAIVSPSWSTVTGLGGGDLAPAMLSVVISWRTSIAARRGMGRTFLGPFILGIQQTDGTPLDSALTTIKSAATTLVNASVGSLNGWAVGVWGLVNAAPPGTTPAGYKTLPRELRDITGYRVRDKFAVMRSRRD